MRALVLAEHDNADLMSPTLNAVSAARALCETDGGGDVDVLIAGQACDPVAQRARAIDGVARVRVVDDARFEGALAEDVAPLLVALAPEYDAVLAPATTTGKNIIPRASALLDVQPVSDVIEIIDATTFKRPIYAGNAIETVRTHDQLRVLTIRPTAFDAAPDAASESLADLEVLEADLVGQPQDLAEFLDRALTQSNRPELTGARVVVSGGRGVGSAENFKLIEDLADRLDGAVGASRAAVDAGFVSNDHQVGQTGKVVAPELYIAVGISGAIQHLAGMKDSRVIVAINKDEDAPIFQVADYGLVADLFDALPELAQALDQ